MKPEPVISPDFTMEDIRKLRDYDAEVMENMTSKERLEYIKKDAEKVRKEFEHLRLMKEKKGA